MGDEAHVRLVDAHAEGDGRDETDALLLEKASWFASFTRPSMPA